MVGGSMDIKYVLEYMKHIKEMEKTNKDPQAKVGLIKGLIDRKTEDIIAKKGEKITPSEKMEIKKEVEANLKGSIKKVGLRIAAIAFAIGIGAKAGIALTEVRYHGIEITKDGVRIEQSEVGNIDIALENEKNDKAVMLSKSDWEESLKVDSDSVGEIQTLLEKKKNLKEAIKNEIDDLTEAETMQNYLKEMYLQKYNQENHTNYTKEDIKIGTRRSDIQLYKDEAENGDVILRKEYNTSKQCDKDLLQIYMGESLVEQGAIYDGVYQYVYSAKEAVAEAKEASGIGKVLIVGIDYVTALQNQAENSFDIMATYKDRLIEAVTEYNSKEFSA